MKIFKKALEPFIDVYRKISSKEGVCVKNAVSSLSKKDFINLYNVYTTLYEGSDDWIDPVKNPPDYLESVLAIMYTNSGLRVVEAWKLRNGSWNFKATGSEIPFGSPMLYKPWPKIPEGLLDD